MKFYTGYIQTEGGERIQFDFSAPDNATQADLDSAALSALAQVVKLDYLEIGSDPA